MESEIRLADLRLLAEGCTGECYRVDDETILKLYFADIDPALADREKRFARAAFVAGVPTAISFDVVSIGNRRGVLYELFNFDSLTRAIMQDAARVDMYATRFARLCKQIHEKRADPALFPDMREEYAGHIRGCAHIPTAEKDALIRRVMGLPAAGTLVHGDLHTSNVMLGHDDILYLIDMGDMGLGTPWFDIGHVYSLYAADAAQSACGHVVHMDNDVALRFWAAFMDAYFDGPDAARQKRIVEKCRLYRYLKLIQVTRVLPRLTNLVDELHTDFLPRLDAFAWDDSL